MAKFYKAFPQLKVMPAVYSFYKQKGTDRMMSAHPIYDFVEKYKGLRNKGYNEYKAF